MLDDQKLRDLVRDCVAENVRGGVGECHIRDSVTMTLAGVVRATGATQARNAFPTRPSELSTGNSTASSRTRQPGQGEPACRN